MGRITTAFDDVTTMVHQIFFDDAISNLFLHGQLGTGRTPV